MSSKKTKARLKNLDWYLTQDSKISLSVFSKNVYRWDSTNLVNSLAILLEVIPLEIRKKS